MEFGIRDVSTVLNVIVHWIQQILMMDQLVTFIVEVVTVVILDQKVLVLVWVPVVYQ